MGESVQSTPITGWRNATGLPHGGAVADRSIRSTRPSAAPPLAERWAIVVLAVIIPACLAALALGLTPALTLISASAVLGALLGLRRPVLGLYSVAVLCTVDSMTRVYLMNGGWLRWNTFNYLLLLVSALGIPFLLRFRNSQLRLLQSLAILLALGLLRSPDLARGMQDLLGMLGVFGLLIYFARAADEPEIWFWLAIVTGVLGALIGLVFYAGVEPPGRIDPNAWSLSSLTALFAIAFGYPPALLRRRGALVLGALASINTSWIFLSGSRGSMLAACCVLAYMIVVTPGLHRRLGMMLAGGVLLFGIATQFGDLEAKALSRVARLFDSSRDLTNRTSHRWSLAVGGWHIFQAHPVVGVGTGGFIPAWRAIGDAGDIPDFDAVARGREAHAAWVKVLAENGLPGGLLLAAVVFSFAFIGWRKPRLRALGLFASITIASIFISTEFQSKGVWFLAAGALVLLNRNALPMKAERRTPAAGTRP